MKYAMCPKCGRRLCKGENGTKVEMECPKCGEFASVKPMIHFRQTIHSPSADCLRPYAEELFYVLIGHLSHFVC